MKPKIREKTILKKKLMKTTMLSTAILVAFLFIGSSVAASLVGNNSETENNSDVIKNTLGGAEISIGKAPTKNSNQDSKESYTNPSLNRGDTFYAVDCDNANFVWFDSDIPGTFNVIAPHAYPDFPQGACFVDDVEWTTDTVGNIYTVDEYGVMTFIGNAGTAEGLVGLAYDPSTDTLYGGSTTDFYTIDMGTGVATHVGPYGGAVVSLMISIACDNDGNMYALELGFGNIAPLHSIDTSTGTATPIGSTGLSLNFGQDIAYDKDNDILYGCLFNYDTFAGEFHTIDTTTGVATYIGDLDSQAQTTVFAIPYTSGPPPEHDLALKSIVDPASGTGSVITPKVTIQNKGLNDEYAIPVNMKIGKWQYTYYLQEDFESGLPGDWTVIDGGSTTDTWTDTNPSGRTPTGGCDGTFMIADSDDAGSGGILMREDLISPSIDLSAATLVTLKFGQHFNNIGSDTASVDISTDGGATWTNLLLQTSDVTGPTYVDISMAAGYSDVKIKFTYDDDSTWAWWWMVDNVEIYDQTFVPEYDETIDVDVMFEEELDFTFPDWTPVDLGLAENVDIDYYCEAEILYADNNTGNNYKDKDFTLHYGFFNDIGVTEIISPVGGVGGIQTPEVVVENFGQNDQNGASVNMLIDEITYGDQWTQEEDTEWAQTSSNYAGGVAPEAYLSWTAINGDYAYLMSPPIDTSGYGTLDLIFKSYINDYSGGYNCYVKVTSDGVTWDDISPWTNPISGDVPAAEHTIDITSYISTATQVMFEFDGPYFNINYWYLDDFECGPHSTDFSGDFPPATMTFTNIYDESAVFDVASGATENVVLPDWTPIAPLTEIDYRVTACTSINTWNNIFMEGFEDFEPGTPPGPSPFPLDPMCGMSWQIFNNDGDSKAWGIDTSNFFTGTNGVSVGYNYAGQDDWLITPYDPAYPAPCPMIIDVGTFDFMAKSTSSYYLEDFEVLVWDWVANGPVVCTPPYTGWVSLGTVISVPNAWTPYSFTLPGTTNPISVAIRCISVDELRLAVDDVAMPAVGWMTSFEGDPGTPGSGFPPAGWTTTQYSGLGNWEGSSYGSHTQEPPGTGDDYAQARDNGIDDYDCGLFTPAIDLTGETAVQLVFERNFQDFAGSGYATVKTYSCAMVFEEELLNITLDDPSGGVHTELTFDPSGYTDPSTVYVEFYYNDELYNTAWGFHIDDVCINVLAQGIDGCPDNDCMEKYITLTYKHDVGVDDIIEWPGGTTTDTWDIQFSYDVNTAPGGVGVAGAEYDGENFLVSEWGYSSRNVFQFDHDGNYLGSWEPTWIPGTSGIRDMAFDGEYFYGSPATTDLYCYDFDGNLIETITAPTACRAIAYDSDDDAFWGNNWDSTLTKFARDGTVLDTIDLPPSMYGCAYDNVCEQPGYDGPFLWIFTGTSTGGGCQLECYDLATKTLTGATHSVSDDFGDYIAGGLFFTTEWEDGYATIGGLGQGTPDLLFGYELCQTSGGGNMYEPDTYPVEAVVENYGTYTEVDFNVHAEILDENDAVFWEADYMITTPMDPGTFQIISFGDVTFTNADEGEYDMVIATELVGDEVPGNDDESWTFVIDIYDDIPPETTHDITGTMGDNDYYVSDVTITLTAEDPWPYKSPSGVKDTYISFDGTTFDIYTGPVVVDEDGNTEFWYYSDDNNGNVETTKGPFEFDRDATPPTIELAAEGSGRTWTLTATVDDETSGVAKVEFYVNDEFVGEVTSSPYVWEYTGASSGDIAQAIAYDNAGNSAVSEGVESYAKSYNYNVPLRSQPVINDL